MRTWLGLGLGVGVARSLLRERTVAEASIQRKLCSARSSGSTSSKSSRSVSQYVPGSGARYAPTVRPPTSPRVAEGGALSTGDRPP